MLASEYARADTVRKARLGGRKFNTVNKMAFESEDEVYYDPPSWHESGTALDKSRMDSLFNEWLEREWDNEHMAMQLSERSRKPAPRTLKEKIVYDRDSAHALLHRSAGRKIIVLEDREHMMEVPEQQEGTNSAAT